MHNKKALGIFTNTNGNWKNENLQIHSTNAFETRSNWKTSKAVTLDKVFG